MITIMQKHNGDTSRLNNSWIVTGLTLTLVFSPIWMLAII